MTERSKSPLRLWLFAALATCGAALFGVGAVAQNAAGGDGVLLTLDGPVTPAAADYLSREIKTASDAGKPLVVIEMDTPGGLMDSMKTIVKAILASNTPVATYVYPQGARSASAGLYIMYAAHVSAMAPSTNTGAATPIELGGAEPPPDNNGSSSDHAPADNPARVAQPAPSGGGSEAENNENARRDAPSSLREAERMTPLGNASALRAKVINDAVAYIRALATERGRNADWAEEAVRRAASVPAREALRLGVIDYVADDLDSLLTQMDGKKVHVAAGDVVLKTAGLKLTPIEPTLLEKILGFLSDPNVSVILMSLGTTGIIIEMWNPGSILPGIVGLTCLALGLYSFQVLPHNWLGPTLMLAGALFIIVEAYTPTLGLVGLAGLGLFAFGLYVAFPEGFRVSAAVIGAVVISVAALLAFILFAVVGSRSHGPLIGAEAIRRREGVIDDWDGKEGHVIVEGERWRARSDKPLKKGDRIRVVEVDGLVLVVRQAKAASLLGALMPGEA
ncbi:MAG TPA: NfeD family protein [Parvularculaceae bacterium]|nr:NfeD family protein [Parvularculaceae bacterium]